LSAPLRDEGVLIMGSGNLVHNLHTYSWGKGSVEPYDWAVRFETRARKALGAGEFATPVDRESLGRDATLAAPTPDHYLPLLYVLAQARARQADRLSGRRFRRRLDFDVRRAGRLKRDRCDDCSLTSVNPTREPHRRP
jgi:aromatic ring-opening dioxygenase catalytic subunit (LigB family)